MTLRCSRDISVVRSRYWREPFAQRDRARETCRNSRKQHQAGVDWALVQALCRQRQRRCPDDVPHIDTTCESGRATLGCWRRWTSTRTHASSRVPLRRKLIASTRARPTRSSRSIRRVFSCVRTMPMTGSARCRRSGSTRIAPVVNDTRSWSQPWRLKRGNPTRFPARLPAREVCKFQYASTAPSMPSAYALLSTQGTTPPRFRR